MRFPVLLINFKMRSACRRWSFRYVLKFLRDGLLPKDTALLIQVTNRVHVEDCMPTRLQFVYLADPCTALSANFLPSCAELVADVIFGISTGIKGLIDSLSNVD